LKRSLHPTRTSCFLLRFPPPSVHESATKLNIYSCCNLHSCKFSWCTN